MKALTSSVAFAEGSVPVVLVVLVVVLLPASHIVADSRIVPASRVAAMASEPVETLDCVRSTVMRRTDGAEARARRTASESSSSVETVMRSFSSSR